MANRRRRWGVLLVNRHSWIAGRRGAVLNAAHESTSMEARRDRVEGEACRDVGFEFETVLLDVDGTLIGSVAAHAEAWTQALREHGVTVDVGQIRIVIGTGADKLLRAVASVSEDSRLSAGPPLVRNRRDAVAILDDPAALLARWRGDAR